METTIIDPFGICFTMLKIRYQTYDESLSDANFLSPSDKVNVFINLETALKYLSMTRDLEKKLLVTNNFSDFMKSDIINIAAHYKDFFCGNNLDTKVFLYMTDLTSESENFKEAKINDEFRSYYINKYRENPNFSLLGNRMINEILPDVQTICDYIPNVYFIKGKDIDGGLIPLIIGKELSDRKNLIISGDLHDTQYTYDENYLTHLNIRNYTTGILACSTNQYLQAITKAKDVPNELVALFENPSFYRVLLACLGDKYRSVDGIKGIKFSKMVGLLRAALNEGKIKENTKSAMMLADIFPDELKSKVFDNLCMLDIENEYQMLGEGDKKSILSQIVDRSDISALQKLNQEKFAEKQLWLEALLK